MEIGETVELVAGRATTGAYEDQFGVKHFGFVVSGYTVIKITSFESGTEPWSGRRMEKYRLHGYDSDENHYQSTADATSMRGLYNFWRCTTTKKAYYKLGRQGPWPMVTPDGQGWVKPLGEEI